MILISWFCFSHQQVNKLIKESQKCSCKGKKAPLCTKKEGKSKGGSSGDEGSTGAEQGDTDKENSYATATS